MRVTAERSQAMIIVRIGQCSSRLAVCHRIRYSGLRAATVELSHVKLLQELLFLFSLLLNYLLSAKVALVLARAERRLVIARRRATIAHSCNAVLDNALGALGVLVLLLSGKALAIQRQGAVSSCDLALLVCDHWGWLPVEHH